MVIFCDAWNKTNPLYHYAKSQSKIRNSSVYDALRLNNCKREIFMQLGISKDAQTIRLYNEGPGLTG